MAAPNVVTDDATAIASNSAYVVGHTPWVDPTEAISYIGFQWGLSIAYENWTFWEQALPGKSYYHYIEGLTEGTTYHFRIIGAARTARSYGSDKFFTTTIVTAGPVPTGFMGGIVSYLNSASILFYDAYQTANGWVWPFWYLGIPLYYLSNVFANLAWQFYYFSSWVDDIAGKVVNILSWSIIWIYIISYVPNLTQIRDWFYKWYVYVDGRVTAWWSATKNTVLVWIADAKSWSLAQVNSLRDTVIAWVADIGAWTATQINTATAAILDIISDVQAWTTAQINNVRNAILATISDLSAWTVTQINTMRDTLMNLVDWAALTKWITTWWNSQLQDVQSLINSTIKTWFPFYDELAKLWSTIALFVANPVEYIWQRFTDWFLGPGG